MVLDRCRKGRDEANRLGLFKKEKGDSIVRNLMMTGDLQQTKDSWEGLGGSLEKVQRPLRHLDKQVQEKERWYVLASKQGTEVKSRGVCVMPTKNGSSTR